MHPTLGTILVLIGTVIFGIALLFTRAGEPRGWYFGSSFLLALAGLLVGIGILIGSPPLYQVG